MSNINQESVKSDCGNKYYSTYGKTSVRFILHGCSNNLSMYTNTEAYVANDIKDPKDIDVQGECSRRPVFK